MCSRFVSKYLITFSIKISCFYSWTRCLFKSINMNNISILICVSLYKLISRNIFFILLSIFILSKRISIFINKLCNYRWTRSSFLLVDMFCITFFIFFSSYKFIAFDIFFVFCSILLIRNSITIFINVFCYYFSIWCEFPCSCYVFVFSIDFCSFFIPFFKCPCSFVHFVFYWSEFFW